LVIACSPLNSAEFWLLVLKMLLLLLLQQYTPQQQLFADPVSEYHAALLRQAGAEGVIPRFWWGCGFVAEPSQRLHMPSPSPSICCFAASAVFTGGLSHVHCRAAAGCQPLHSLQDELNFEHECEMCGGRSAMQHRADTTARLHIPPHRSLLP
jgi:hypothetical protein